MRTSSLAILLLAAASASAAENTPTYTRDVAPVVFKECASCHRPGEAAPFPLLTYQDTKKRGKLIAHLTKSRQMPPWKADKGDVAFRNERRLTDAEIAVFQQWTAAGMPEGDPKDLPAAPKFSGVWSLGKPDLVVKMPKAYHVPAEGRDIYRNFAIALNLDEDKWVRAIDFRPSAGSVVHHSLFFYDPSGTSAKKELASGQVGIPGGMSAIAKLIGKGRGGLGGALGGLGGDGGQQSDVGGLGGWAVGAQAIVLPDGLAYRLPKGSDLILSTHFHMSGKAEEEQSTIALYFADKAPKQRFKHIQLPIGFGALAGIDIPAGKKDFAIEDSFTLPVDVKAFGISAHAHYLGKEFTMTATLPDGATKTLLHVPDWDFGWQEQYQFRDFYALPKDTKLHVRMTYDNSADNPRNPTSPPRRVRWGKESTDEMGSVTLQVVAAKESEFAKLRDGYQRHVQESAVKALSRKLAENKK